MRPCLINNKIILWYHEQEFQNTQEAKRRFVLAYAIMLDFFGIKILDKNGNVARAANWKDRFQHLNEWDLDLDSFKKTWIVNQMCLNQ